MVNLNHSNKRLTFVIGSLQEIGGTERHLVAILPELAARGWTIQVFALFKKGVMADRLEAKGIPVELILSSEAMRKIRGPRFLTRIIRCLATIHVLVQKLKRTQTAALHFFLPEPYIIGMVAAHLAKFQGFLFMSRRSINYYQKRRWGSAFVEAQLHPRTSLIMGNSQAIMEDLKKEGIPEEKLKLIYNGIDLSPFSQIKPRQVVRQALNIPEHALVMIKVANLLSYKGHADLLMALSQIKGKLPAAWMMLCVGRDDGLGESLIAQTHDLGLESHILWLNVRTDIPDLLSASDIGILCSHEEGFSNAILEGMAAQLPMIVTDVGGNKEAVLQGETGIVVPPQNPKLLSEAILNLACDHETAHRFGVAAQARVKAHFSMEACVTAYDETYRTFIKSPDINAPEKTISNNNNLSKGE